MPSFKENKYLVRARIKWFKRADNKDRPLPKGIVFRPARFEARKEEWPHIGWSLVINFQEPWDNQGITIANVAFLSPDAPKELLQPGCSFELLDGGATAEGTVLAYL
jgi:hypothetical protein